MDVHGFVTEHAANPLTYFCASSDTTVRLAQILNRATAVVHKHSFFLQENRYPHAEHNTTCYKLLLIETELDSFILSLRKSESCDFTSENIN